MIWATKKFEREIQSLKRLVPEQDPLSADELASIKQRIFSAVKNQTPPKIFYRVDWRLRFAKVAAPAILGLSLIGGTAYASGGSKPGDLLYPIKRATETIRLDLAASDQSKAVLQAQFAIERIKELAEIKQSVQSSANTSGQNNGSAATSTGGAAVQITATSGTSTLQNIGGQTRLEIRAQNDASLQVNEALNAMQKVQDKLQNEGNKSAADAISQNIAKLRSEAQIQDIKIGPRKIEWRDKPDDGGITIDFQATTTIPQAHKLPKLKIGEHNSGEPSITVPSILPLPEVQGSSTGSFYRTGPTTGVTSTAPATPIFPIFQNQLNTDSPATSSAWQERQSNTDGFKSSSNNENTRNGQDR
ncbi:MAG: DUF5667 domain-containing protein [Candidatus Doudnabacteria bacterium]|nr:DUF5667 domain-containing protein [Candidatus Doudnabacteria bacterium]